MITLLDFEPTFLDLMKRQNKQDFWTKQFLSVLFAQEDFTTLNLPDEANTLRIMTIKGPVVMGKYEIIVLGGISESKVFMPLTREITIPVSVRLRISDACKEMKSNPWQVEEDPHTRITIHKVQNQALQNGQIGLVLKQVPSHLTNLPANHHKIWDPLFTQEALHKIMQEISEDNTIHGNGLVNFPPSTNQLSLKSIHLHSNPNSKKVHKPYLVPKKAFYRLTVLPVHTYKDQSGKEIANVLSADPINIVISISARILNRVEVILTQYNQDLNKKAAHATFALLPTIKIADIYSSKIYPPENTADMSKVAESMMSSILQRQVAATPAVCDSHEPISQEPNQSSVSGIELEQTSMLQPS